MLAAAHLILTHHWLSSPSYPSRILSLSPTAVSLYCVTCMLFFPFLSCIHSALDFSRLLSWKGERVHSRLHLLTNWTIESQEKERKESHKYLLSLHPFFPPSASPPVLSIQSEAWKISQPSWWVREKNTGHVYRRWKDKLCIKAWRRFANPNRCWMRGEKQRKSESEKEDRESVVGKSGHQSELLCVWDTVCTVCTER